MHRFGRSKQRLKEGPIGCDFIIWNMSDKDAQVQFRQGLLMLEPAIDRYEYIERFLRERQERTVLGATPTRFRYGPYLTSRLGKAALTPAFTHSSRRIRTPEDYLWPTR